MIINAPEELILKRTASASKSCDNRNGRSADQLFFFILIRPA